MLMTAESGADLFGALAALCNRFRAEGGIDCHVTLGEAHTRFDAELSDVVYRTVRELLANVRQHARATRVAVSSARARDGSALITVADNGVGFPEHWRHSNPFTADTGVGLWSIDQRLRKFDAYLDIHSTKQGSRVTVVLPANLLSGD
jgi:signal transduction histidine kinase